MPPSNANAEPLCMAAYIRKGNSIIKDPKIVILGFNRYLLFSPERLCIQTNFKVKLVYIIKGKALLN